jgi:hypothetical protein
MNTHNPETEHMVLRNLSGAMKFCWLLIGFLLWLPGVLLSWVTNVGNHQKVRSEALTFALIGFGILVVVHVAILILRNFMAIPFLGYYHTWF